MVVRRRKKMNHQLGKRTHGHGDKKNRKGKGVRGGLGRAGSHKHKFATYWATFGIKYRLKAKKKGTAMNLSQIELMVPIWMAEKKVSEKSGQVELDGQKIGVDKILGMGEATRAYQVVNMTVAKNALEKIQAQGGAVSEPKQKPTLKGAGK
jgi:large subunit ribosomal protein L15